MKKLFLLEVALLTMLCFTRAGKLFSHVYALACNTSICTCMCGIMLVLNEAVFSACGPTVLASYVGHWGCMTVSMQHTLHG